MSKTLRSIADLTSADFPITDDLDVLERIAARYAVAVPPALAALIDPADPRDPLALQVLPSARELVVSAGEHSDPIGDAAHSPVPGLVHRHTDRVLLKIVAVCPVYCRFCFRRATIGPGGTEAMSPEDVDRAVAYIAQHPEIWEVILTGGDPFVLAPRRAADLTQRLAAIPHVRVLRWHTRMPVADPASVSDAFAQAIATAKKTVYVALHANHPRELTQDARAACNRLSAAGVTLVSQTVLLHGVNDDAATLEALFRAFVEMRIKPYYLHQLDLAPGTSHFRVPISRGQALMAALRQRLSGLALPTYVLDLPGGHGKVPIGPAYLDDPPQERVRDLGGRWHAYSAPTSRSGPKNP